jgi:type II secretory pathway pseudopilin PulG
MTYHRVKFRRERAFAFTLGEIMIVVAVIALLAALALPDFMRARKRAQVAQVKEDLRLIDAALNQYAIETGKRSGTSVGTADWTAYLEKDTRLYATGEDVLGNEFGPQTVTKCLWFRTTPISSWATSWTTNFGTRSICRTR